MFVENLNYVAVLIAALVNMALGAFWYSKSGFGSQWMKLVGLTKEDADKAKAEGMTKNYVFAFVGALFMACALGVLVNVLGAMTVFAGAQLGFLVWLGFVATTSISDVLWARKPIKLYMINVGYYLVALVLMGAVLAVWH